MARVPRSQLSRYNKRPYIVTRIQDDESRVLGDTSTREVGEITTDLFPVSEDFGPGHQGSSFTFQCRKPFLHHEIRKDPDSVVRKQFLSKTVTVEVRERAANRALQTVVFRGRIDADTRLLNTGANSVDIVFRDAWQWATNSPVEMPTENRTIGDVFRSLAQGYWTEQRWDSEEAGYVDVQHLFDPPLWAVNGSGSPIVHLDPELFSIPNPTGDLDLRGEVTASIAAELIRKSGDYIPVIRYQRGDAYFTRLKRGWMKMDLVVGTIGKTGVVHRLVPSVMSISGTTSYSNIVNRIRGRGDYQWKSAAVELEPAWSADLEADVLEDPKLNGETAYRNVGTLYRIPTKIYPFDLAPQSEDGDEADPTKGNFRMRFFARNGMTIEDTEEPDLVNDPWKPYDADYEMPESLDDESLVGVTLDRRSRMHWRAGNFRFIRFKSPQTGEYLTAEQQTALDSTGESETTKVFLKIKVQAIEIGDRIEEDSGVYGDFPREIVRFHESRQTKEVIDEAERVAPNPEGGLTVITESKSRSGRDTLRQAVNELVRKASRPDRGWNIVLAYLHYGQLLGVQIDRIISSEGKVFENGLEWMIAGGNRDYRQLRTSLLLSDSFYQLQSGSMISMTGTEP